MLINHYWAPVTCFLGLFPAESATIQNLSMVIMESLNPDPPRSETVGITPCTPGSTAILSSSSSLSGGTSRERKVLRALIYIVIAHVCCWTPFFVAYDLEIAYSGYTSPSLFRVLSYINMAVNPFLYAFSSGEFLHVYRDVMTGLVPKCFNRSVQRKLFKQRVMFRKSSQMSADKFIPRGCLKRPVTPGKDAPLGPPMLGADGSQMKNEPASVSFAVAGVSDTAAPASATVAAPASAKVFRVSSSSEV